MIKCVTTQVLIKLACLALTHGMSVSPCHTLESMQVFVLQYKFVEGILEKRAPHRAAHLDMLSALSDSGECLLAGALANPRERVLLDI